MKIKALKYFDQILFILLVSTPFIFLFGKFVSDLSIILCGLLFITISILIKKTNYIFSKISILFYSFNLYLIIRSLLSSDIYLSLESSIFLFRFWFFSLSLLYILNTKKSFLRNYLYTSLSAILLIFIDSCIQFFFGYNITGNQYLGERISSFFGKEYILGGYIGRLLLLNLAIITIIFNKNKNQNIAIILLFFLSLIIILLSGDRIGILYFIIALIVFIVFSYYSKIFKLYLSMFFSISLLSIIFFVENIYNRVIVTTLRQVGLIGDNINNGNLHIFSSGLTEVYLTAINIFNDNKLFGIGTKLFRKYCLEEKYIVGDGCTTHPHNYLIQLLTETGLFGLFLYFNFIFLLLFILFKNIYLRYIKDFDNYLVAKIYINILLLVHLVPFYPTGSIFHNFTSIQIFLPIGFFLYFYFKDQEKKYN